MWGSPRPDHLLVVAAVGSLRPGCSGSGGGFIPSPPLCVLPWFALARCGHSEVFRPSGATLSLWGYRCSVATQPPRPLPGGTPTGFPPLQRPCGPLLVPHSGGIVGHSGGLAAPVIASHSQGFAGLFFPPDSRPPPLHLLCPMAAPHSRLVGGRGGGFPFVSTTGHHFPR